MQCFAHDDAAAVGVCRNCGRGLCRGCAAETPGGLACRGRCEAEVAETAQMVRRGVVANRGSIGVQGAMLVLTTLGAAAFGYSAITQAFIDGDWQFGLLYGVLAALMAVMAVVFGRAILVIRKIAPTRP